MTPLVDFCIVTALCAGVWGLGEGAEIPGEAPQAASTMPLTAGGACGIVIVPIGIRAIFDN